MTIGDFDREIFQIDRQRFTQFFYDAFDASQRFAVAQLTATEQALFGVQSQNLWLSKTTLDEHKLRHPEVLLEDYLMIPQIVANAAVWGGHQERRYLLLVVAHKSYRAAIKASQDHEHAWFLSLVISTKQKPPKGAVLLRKSTDEPGWRP
jgi:hypothetical protein